MPETVSMIGYTRVSKADGSQVHHLQHDALIAAASIPSGSIRTASRVPATAGRGWMHASPHWRPGTRWWSGSSTGSAAAFAIWSTPSAS